MPIPSVLVALALLAGSAQNAQLGTTSPRTGGTSLRLEGLSPNNPFSVLANSDPLRVVPESVIEITFTSDRRRLGRLVVRDPAGNVRFGPIFVYGKSHQTEADRVDNHSRNPLTINGDTPAGTYDATLILPEILPLCFRLYRPSAYGREGAIVLIPTGGDALVSERNGRHGFLVHSGAMDAKTLRPTLGCVRVSPSDMKSLVDHLRLLELGERLGQASITEIALADGAFSDFPLNGDPQIESELDTKDLAVMTDPVQCLPGIIFQANDPANTIIGRRLRYACRLFGAVSRMRDESHEILKLASSLHTIIAQQLKKQDVLEGAEALITQIKTKTGQMAAIIERIDRRILVLKEATLPGLVAAEGVEKVISDMERVCRSLREIRMQSAILKNKVRLLEQDLKTLRTLEKMLEDLKKQMEKEKHGVEEIHIQPRREPEDEKPKKDPPKEPKKDPPNKDPPIEPGGGMWSKSIIRSDGTIENTVIK